MTNRQPVEIDWTETLTEALNAPGSLGDTYTRFYNYSFLNQIRLLMQGVAEPVASYSRWQELGRQVRNGSKAKSVLAPVLVSKAVSEDGRAVTGDDGQPVKRPVLVGFRVSRSVFALSDTDGDDLPEIELPAFDVDRALSELGISRVRFDMIDGNIQGYSTEVGEVRRVAVNPVAKFPAKTLLHELAHIMLGHCKDRAEGSPCARHIAEGEAEATAYIVAKQIELTGWDAAESRAYIAHWLTGRDLEAASVRRIFGAVDRILTAGRARADIAEPVAA